MVFGQGSAGDWLHVRPWSPVMLVWLAVALVAVEPATLLPIARAYAALCVRYPTLTLVTNHAPALPLALFLSLAGMAFLAGVWSGVAGLRATLRFNCRLRQDGKPIPARVADIAGALGLTGRVTYVTWDEPTACCYGFFRPDIAVTAGLIDRLDDEELVAVLGHEREHLRRRDPLRYFLLDVLAAAAFMLPIVPALRNRWRARTELAADRAALVLASRGALAGALLAVIRSDQPPSGVAGLTATEARIAQLGGELVMPAIPKWAIVASGAIIAAVVMSMTVLTASADLVRMTCPFCPWLS